MTTREPGGPEKVLKLVLRQVRRVVVFIIGPLSSFSSMLRPEPSSRRRRAAE